MREIIINIGEIILQINYNYISFQILKFVGLFVLLKILTKTILFSFKKYFIVRNKKNSLKYSEDRMQTLIFLISSILKYISYLVILIALLSLSGVEPTTILSGAGFIGIVFGIGFQDLLKDVVAGFFIVFENQYEINDMVQIGKFAGVVKQIGVKTTILEAYEGEIFIINNREAFNIINYSKAKHSYVIVSFIVNFETDLNELFLAINNYLELLSEKYPQIIEKPSLKGVTEIRDYGYKIEIHTKASAEDRVTLKRLLNKDITDYVKSKNFELTYPKYIVKEEK